MAINFEGALRRYASNYHTRLNETAIAQLGAYYELVMAWNDHLHLVAPCHPAEFATRHVLESLLALPHLPFSAGVVDVGSGAGLPIIPCLIVRPDLSANLVESSRKKAVFLREALSRLGISDRAKVSAKRFESIPPPAVHSITCRALDKFVDQFPELAKWSAHTNLMLLFGGDGLREQIEILGLKNSATRIPGSERRFLFVVEPNRSPKTKSPRSKVSP